MVWGLTLSKKLFDNFIIIFLFIIATGQTFFNSPPAAIQNIVGNLAELYIMQKIILLFSIIIYAPCFAQVENYELLTKHIQSSNIRTITKFVNVGSFKEKIFKIEFNKNEQLVTIEDYRYIQDTIHILVMRQEIKYDKNNNKNAVYIKAPDGSSVVDTFIYDKKNTLIGKRRVLNGNVVKSWDYFGTKTEEEIKKEFDQKGNLIKLIEGESNYINYTYDDSGNLIKEIQTKDGKENKMMTYQYDKENQLNSINVYLLYIANDKKPIKYSFEYEYF